MSHDDASGRIKLYEQWDGAYIDWEDVGQQKNFEMADERLLKCAKKLNGYYIKNPLWSNGLFDKRLVTVHPLGGCPMADNGTNGVVNHKGQVFSGKDTFPFNSNFVQSNFAGTCQSSSAPNFL